MDLSAIQACRLGTLLRFLDSGGSGVEEGMEEEVIEEVAAIKEWLTTPAATVKVMRCILAKGVATPKRLKRLKAAVRGGAMPDEREDAKEEDDDVKEEDDDVTEEGDTVSEDDDDDVLGEDGDDVSEDDGDDVSEEGGDDVSEDVSGGLCVVTCAWFLPCVSIVVAGVYVLAVVICFMTRCGLCCRGLL